jgi:dihydrolipoamide dehydrogenase
MHDLIIIGGGPGGYLAAERAGAAGLSVLLIEKDSLGGACLNRGCIPTKSLLNSAKLYLHAKESAAYGVKADSVELDWAAAQAWKEKTVAKLREGVAASLRAAKVEILSGTGCLCAPGEVRVAESGKKYQAKNVIIASGSSPALPPIPGAAGNRAVMDSTALLDIKEIPRRLAVIGGGVIGIEFASLFSALGAKVAVVEMLPEILPFMDAGQAPLMRRALKGVDFRLGSKVEGIEGGKLSWSRGGKTESTEADAILMAAGRVPNLEGLFDAGLGLDADERGIRVDERMRTNLPGIYAAGDVTGKSLLAHSAYRMAEVAVDSILGGKQLMRYDALPWAVYSLPEAAGAGLTEAQARERGIEARCARVPLAFSGRFVAENGAGAPGECKLVADGASGRILGVHLVGPYASEMIWGASAAIEMEMRAADLSEVVFPHPSVAEALREAARELT